MLAKTLKQKRDAEERLRQSDANKQLIYTESDTGDQVIVDPSAALTEAVTALNTLVNAVTLAGAGGVTISAAGQTITISGADIEAQIKYYEPLTNGSTTSPEILFTPSGDVLMGEVS